MSTSKIVYSDIIAAQATLKGIIKETSLLHSKSFSRLGDCDVFMKLENLQTTGSFKVRGAYNKIAHLSEKERNSPVVAASAGNHAQGVAYSSTKLGVKSTIFMPSFTPPLKAIATRHYGAEVILAGDSFDDAFQISQEYCKEHKGTYIHPFNDPLIIAGQGTVGIEIFQQLPEMDVIIVPIGGGGLISGIAIALKTLNPKIKIIGVEAEAAASMSASKKANSAITIPHATTIADGIAVKRPGDLTLALVQKYVDDIVTVSDEEIALTTYLMLERTKMLAEPSGVASVAAILFKKADFTGKKVVPVVSGGNINMSILEQIVEKGMMVEGLRTSLQILIPDLPGELNKLTTLFESFKISIQSIEHIRSITSVPIGYVQVVFTVDLQNKGQLQQIVDELTSRELPVEVLN